MSHGHDDHAHGGHGHAATAAGAHGPAEFPPIPNPRSISPAREDFDAPWPGKVLVWPFVWTAVALLFFVAARSSEHSVGAHEAASPDAAHGAAAPSGGEPAKPEHSR